MPHEVHGPASTRAYLRGALPAIYREDDLTMRFVGGLEEVLDPIVSLLDSLHANFDPDLAPPELVACVAAWLGLDIDDTLDSIGWADDRVHRALARNATKLVRVRGTRRGLERLLRLAFPALKVSVEDDGRATASPVPRDPDAPPAPGFLVTTEVSRVSAETREVLERVIRRNAPAHVPGRLRIGPAGEVVAV